MNKWIIAVLATVFFNVQLQADAGMWVTKDIIKNIGEMRKAGLKLSASDIYDINKASLKDAVIGLTNEDFDFDSFASASFISDKGLVITNYHPVIGHLERFSNADRDFLKFGYWSKNQAEESYCRGLQVIQLVKMEDVTEEVLKGTEGLNAGEKTNKLNENGRSLVVQKTRGTNTKGRITSFMGGNQYILSTYKIYKDVRMVAAPPMVLGKFGGDADNWAWPRHTADFALLRVYVNKDNAPAEHSKENVPLSGNPFLKISIAGVEENDFAMTMGYPGRSKLFIPSFAVQYMVDTELPARLKIRSEKLRIINEGLEQRPEIKYRYTSRINSLTNNYLRWKGELNGLKKMDLSTQKKAEEAKLTAWIEADPKRLEKYGKLMETQTDIYQKLIPYKTADLYFNEAGLNGADVVPFSGKFEKLIQMFNRKNLNQKAIDDELGRLRPLAEQFYKDWDYTIDLEMYRNMFFLYYENVGDQFKTEVMYEALKKFNGDVDAYARWAFENSIVTAPEKMKAYLVKVDTTNIEVLTSDPVYQLSISFYKVYTDRVGNQMKRLENEQGFYYNLYMEALAEMNKGKNVAPDANRTQRLSYGRVMGASPADGLSYNYYTTLEGLFEKNANNPDNSDYYVPKKIQTIHQAKDFGRYATDGTVRVNFLTNNHTTSGSSGSPVLNRRGELIGLNFDRIAEGVASDYQFLPELSRSIVVDIRYVLFLLEKYSPSSHLVSEMTISDKK